MMPMKRRTWDSSNREGAPVGPGISCCAGSTASLKAESLSDKVDSSLHGGWGKCIYSMVNTLQNRVKSLRWPAVWRK